jgi:threonylcarbamoyladenosine tRNA methylthiotransferase MtaB
MRRRYKREFYSDLVYKLNEEIKDVGIGVDVIVGFPGETDDYFESTRKFLQELPVMYLHTFSYSERKNTVSVKMPGKVDIKKIKERSRILRNISLSKRYDFYRKHIGTYQKVLFETKKENGCIEGYTTNYIRVKVNKDKTEDNLIKEVVLTEPGENTLPTLLKGVEPLGAEIVS